MIETRVKRFTRLETAPNFLITSRLLYILRDICRHPLIRKDQLASRHPELSRDALRQIIYNLFHGRLIAEPVQQAEVHKRVPGSLPTYLSPDRLGVQLYSAFFADPLPTPRYTQDNTRGKWDYIKHQATTTTTLLQFEDGAKEIDGLEHYTEADLWLKFAPERQLNQPIYDPKNPPKIMSHDVLAAPSDYSTIRTEPEPSKIKSRLDWEIKLPGHRNLFPVNTAVAAIPDGRIGRRYNGKNHFSKFESDEGTETILPGRNIRQSMQVFLDTSLYQKMLAYIPYFRHRGHVTDLGIPAFDVTIITSTPRRAENIVSTLGPVLMTLFNIHPNFTKVSDRQSIAKYENNPYHPTLRYLNLKGEDVSYLSN